MKTRNIILPLLVLALASCGGNSNSIESFIDSDITPSGDVSPSVGDSEIPSIDDPSIEEDINNTHEFNTGESKTRLVLSSKNKTNTAYASFEAKYDEKGIYITTNFCDNDLYAKNIYDIGFDDNIEFVISPVTQKTVMQKNSTFHFLINGAGETYFQTAVNGSSFGVSYSPDLKVVLGENLKYTFSLTNVKDDGFNGFKSEIYLSYDALQTNYDKAYGKLAFCPGMRNTHNYSTDSVWSSYRKNGCTWGNPSTFVGINSDGTFGAARITNFDKLLIGDGALAQQDWQTFYEDFKDVNFINYVDSSTSVASWSDTLDEMSDCTVKELLIALGDNDLAIRTTDTVKNDIGKLIDKAYTLFPAVKVYLLPVINTPRNINYVSRINQFNTKIKEYADSKEDITFIDLTPLNTSNSYRSGYYSTSGAMNFLGHNHVINIMKRALGIILPTLPSAFGHNDMYYSSYGYETSSFKGNVAVEGSGEKDQYLVFSKDSSATFDVSLDMSASGIYNADAYPKFGISILGETDTLFFYVDGSANLSAKKVGYVRGRNHTSYEWNSSVEKEYDISYTNGNVVSLAVSRTSDGKITMSVNGTTYATNTGIFGTGEKLTVGVLSFNTHTFISNWNIN